MKRVIALALALVLSLSVGVIAFASSDEVELGIGGKKLTDTWYFAAPNSTTTIVMDIWNDLDGDGIYYDSITDTYDTNELVLGAVNVGKAMDDNYLKITAKAIKGAEYFKGFEFKKNTAKQLYLEVKTVELYIGKTPEIGFEVKVTFSKPAKIGEKISQALAGENNGYYTNATSAITTTSAVNYFGKFFNAYSIDTAANNYKILATTTTGAISNNDYILTKTENWKFGWSDEYKLDDGSNDVDATYIADPGFKSISQDKGATNVNNVNRIHVKYGKGEVSCFDFGDTAYVEVKMADQPVINMFYSEAAIKAITNKYQDVEFLFYNWKGAPTLDFTADVELYVDEDEVGEEPVLYYFDPAAGTLTKVDADYADETFLFRTRQLGAYVVASKPISTTAPVETTAAAAGTSAAATGNPHTGVSDFVGVAVALAVVSMAAAGAVALKK